MPARSGNVTKDLFLEALECRTRGWFLRHAESEPPGIGNRLRMMEGQEIHRRARGLYARGIYAGDVAKTQSLLGRGTVSVIFEAAFEVDRFAARADVILKVKGGVHLVEVKSSLHDDGGVKDAHIDDLAYTVMVLRKAGLPVARAELLLLSRNWRLGMPDSKLFIRSDHTKAVIARARGFEKLSSSVSKALLSRRSPAATLILGCKRCEYFESECLGKGLDDPIFDLPRLSPSKFQALKQEAILTVRGIPHDFPLTPNQARVRQAVVARKPSRDRAALCKLLADVKWPAVYLDFETLMTALPLWPGVVPHEQIVTQYSIHVCERLGRILHHREYLADARGDRRRDLAERLVADTAGKGSIVVYHAGFEKSVIGGLAERFPDLRKALVGLLGRVFDLERVFTSAYYHPGFRGSSSIKAVLPVVIPSMGYDGLEVGDGGEAIAAFAKMASDACQSKERERLRKALRAYCHQDTLAMVKLHSAMAKMAG
ncbi:MAG: DUF2779 domain-containing protein [Phycisphaerales bacterium]